MGTISEKFLRLKEQYPGVKLAEFLMVEYIKYGSYYEMESVFEATHVALRNNIMKHIEEVKLEKPYLYDMFMFKVNWNKENPGMAAKAMKTSKASKAKKEFAKPLDKNCCKKFNEEIFKSLPKELEYTKLLSMLKDYNTGQLTGEYLARLASKNGIKLYNVDVYRGTKNYIKF